MIRWLVRRELRLAEAIGDARGYRRGVDDGLRLAGMPTVAVAPPSALWFPVSGNTPRLRLVKDGER